MAKNKKSRSGIAIIIAVIFMMAFLTISTTTATTASNMLKASSDSYKSIQAYYNAEQAAGAALYAYKHPGPGADLTGGTITGDNNEQKGFWKILGVSGGQGNLSDMIGDYHVYPYPGTGTAGKNCDVYNPVNNTETRDDLLLKYGIDQKQDQDDYGTPEDFSCNWNKIRSFDSAVEIPLYATTSTGERVWLNFTEIQIKVRTACDEIQLIKGAEKEIYDETGMCGKGERFGMMANYDPNAPNVPKNQTTDILNNTVLNWGIYSDKGDANYLIPIKSTEDKDEANTNNSNIHTKAINDANPGLPFSTSVPEKGDFVVLDGNTMGSTVIKMGADSSTIINILNKSSANPATPQISNPYLRLTVENKFLAEDSTPMDPKYIPHLEYQILYKINGTSLPAEMDINTAQISGIPVIIGEGYSGGFKHTVKMTIIETKTGFDYLYQKP